VERRVETLTFVDETTARRHTSVYFVTPAFAARRQDEGLALKHVLLALMAKDVLRNFDVRDEEGRAMAVLTRRENAAIAAEILL
jgi:hypothetical protein